MKRALILICLMCMALTCAGCAGTSKVADRELPQVLEEKPLEPEEIVHPPVSSYDAELFIDRDETGSSVVVNQYGTVGSEYSVDPGGNIVSEDGTVIVSRENAVFFERIESLKFDESEYTVSLAPLNLPTEYFYNWQYTQYSVPFLVNLKISNPGATNQIVLIESSDPEVASVLPNQNAKLIANGMFAVEPGCLAIQPEDPEKQLTIVVAARKVGEATITARALSGYASAQCTVQVEFGEGDGSAVPESWINSSEYSSSSHVHSYDSSVTAPTIWNEGYTLYECRECGHSYKGNYTPVLVNDETAGDSSVHKHDYTSSTVAPTEDERGYTLFVCQECGDSYKANYVDPVSK